jgi:hypothetical protein
MNFDLTTLITAAKQGATSVYHAVLDTGTAISAWETAHPEVGPLIEEGVVAANALLARFGVPAGTLEVVGEDILTGLKGLAAADATVPSTSTTPAPTAQVATAAASA